MNDTYYTKVATFGSGGIEVKLYERRAWPSRSRCIGRDYIDTADPDVRKALVKLGWKAPKRRAQTQGKNDAPSR